ncbi:sister chromatid cohesion protein 1 [Rhizina undulata]
MFYSETLLSKTGPLARVWLSANLERKLSKTHILQSNIESSVGAIVGQDQAPMALRLSGQLLLGVVRIYSRKARYLLEDCNEALMKIKMAFRPGNVDLPAGATAHTAAQLTLPDVITELDLLLPDPTLDLAELGELPFETAAHIGRKADITLDESRQFLGSIEQARAARGEVSFEFEEEPLQLEDDLELDIGPMPGEETPRPHRAATIAREISLGPFDLPEIEEISMERGREAPPERGIGEELFPEEMMEGVEGVELISPKAPEPEPPRFEEYAEEIGLGFDEDDAGIPFGLGEEGDLTALVGAPSERAATVPPPESVREESVREESPLSSVRSSVERELSADIRAHGAMLDISFADEIMRAPSEEVEAYAQRVIRKRKVVVDPVTEIRAKQIKAQQEDRTRILKEPSFLPRDPTLLALLSLQKTGGFAQSVFYPKNMAPELKNLLSPEFVKRMAELKRKREREAVGGEEIEERPSPAKQVRLDIFENEPTLGMDVGEETFRPEELAEGEEAAPSPEVFEFGAEEEEMPPMAGEEEELPLPAKEPEAFPAAASPEMEERPPSAIPPAPISLETRQAVHVLREQFSEPHAKPSVTFQELLPPATTNRIDATKMFFEVLVLATKDAIKVQQEEGFGDVEIRAKKALWDAWAEEKDESQIAEEKEKEVERRVGRTEIVIGREGGVEGGVTAA